MTLRQRSIADLSVSAIGLGGASWSLIDLSACREDDRAGRNEEEAIAAIRAAVDAGVRLIDTARAYTTATHPGHSEALIRRALSGCAERDEVIVASKGGHYRDGDQFPVCASPTALRRDCEASLALLAVERIDLYQLHWPDPTLPIRTSVEALVELREAGWIRHLGVCNVSLGQLAEALAVGPIASVQNHFSPFDQGDREMVDFCAEHGIAYLSYSPLRRGADGAGPAALSDAFPAAAAVAERLGVSLPRLALAWLLSVSPTLIPICGASRPESIRDSLLAPELELDQEDLAALDFGAS
jgi:aryl-alcohol dehydrogenase-like predicted oxidoreductase